MMLQNEVKLKAEAEVTKYRNRYKKLCELLKDAEGKLYICSCSCYNLKLFLLDSEYEMVKFLQGV